MIMAAFHLSVNEKLVSVEVDPQMPLLWVLRDFAGLTGTKYGCGIAQCGACTVHVDGEPRRSCVTPVSDVAGSEITTIEAIGETPAGKAVQAAWLDLEVVQCGYCQSGQIMSATALVASNPTPSVSNASESAKMATERRGGILKRSAANRAANEEMPAWTRSKAGPEGSTTTPTVFNASESSESPPSATAAIRYFDISCRPTHNVLQAPL